MLNHPLGQYLLLQLGGARRQVCFQCVINIKSQEQREWISKCLVESSLFVIIGPFAGCLQLTVT